MTDPVPSFGRALRASRESRSLSPEGLAERAHLSVRAIMLLEAGRGRLRGESVRRLVRALELTGSERADFERAARPASLYAPEWTASAPGVTVAEDSPESDQPTNSTRLDFTLSDAARVRVGSALGPLAETALAFSGLQRGAVPPVDTGRVEAARHFVIPRDRALASFLWLGPTLGFDFYTTSGWTATFEAGREAVLGGTEDLLAGEAGFWVHLRTTARRYGFLPAEGGTGAENALKDGDVDRWRAVIDRLEDNFRSWIEPSWSAIRDRLAAEEARFAHLAATGGVESLIAGLGHRIRWTGSGVEIPDTSWTGTHSSVIPLGGRGLTIVPSMFAVQPLTYFPLDPAAPGLLIVPVPWAGLAPRQDAVDGPRGEALLGRTRAAVLVLASRRPYTTSELSRELGIALSGASQHAAVLRRAGLMTTVREGGHVQHSITELGERLLAQW